MKTLFFTILFFGPFLNFAQKPTANKLPDRKQLIKNELIKKTREDCALPKYYKTEKVNVKLVEKSKPIIYEYGIGLVNIKDSARFAKFLFLKDGESHLNYENRHGYPIDSIWWDIDSKGTNYSVMFTDIDSFPRILEFTFFNDPEKIDLRYNNDFEFYKRRKKEKIGMTDEVYFVEIYYWAMSKGGTVRLYKDEGYAYVNTKGKITLEVSDSEL
jgi:hypothetical protein